MNVAHKRQSSGIFEDVDSWLVGERTQCSYPTLPKQNHSIETRCSDSLKRTRDSSIATLLPLQNEDEYVEMQPLTDSVSSLLATNIKPQTLNVSKLSSAKSLEVLSCDFIDEIAAFSLSNDDNCSDQHPTISPQHDYDYPSNDSSLLLDSPEIPRRHSSLISDIESQVSNEVLIQQGKRLSVLLNCKELPQNKPTLSTSVKSVFNKMRKVSLPAVNYTRPAKSPKPKRKISIQMISEANLTKHPSMDEMTPKMSSNNLAVPCSTGSMEGKRSHSFTTLKDAFYENEDYETMLPQGTLKQNNHYNETSVKLIIPPSLHDRISVTEKPDHVPWALKKIRKKATVSPPLRPPIPSNFMKQQNSLDSPFIPIKASCSSKEQTYPWNSLPRQLSPKSSIVTSSPTTFNVNKVGTRKGSHPIYRICLPEDDNHNSIKSKSVHDLISFFTA